MRLTLDMLIPPARIAALLDTFRCPTRPRAHRASGCLG